MTLAGVARPVWRLGLVLALGALPVTGLAQAPKALAPPGEPARSFPAPSRPVAEIISPIWATERQRDAVDEVGQVVRALGLQPGQTIADIGAGSGYYAVRLATVVGPQGHVFAQDVTPSYLSGLAARAKRLGLANVTVVRGEAHDPRLAPGSVDVALLVHMYHEIAQPFALLHNLVPAMRPGGRVGIVDLDRATSEHGTPPKLLRCELAAAGYREVGFSQLSGDVGYLAVFAPPEAGTRPAPSAVRSCPLSAP